MERAIHREVSHGAVVLEKAVLEKASNNEVRILVDSDYVQAEYRVQGEIGNNIEVYMEMIEKEEGKAGRSKIRVDSKRYAVRREIAENLIEWLESSEAGGVVRIISV